MKDERVTTWKEFAIETWFRQEQTDKSIDELKDAINEGFKSNSEQHTNICNRLLVMETTKKASWKTISVIALVVVNVITIVILILQI